MSGGERDHITARLDAALERCEARGWKVRAIYLDEEDRGALDKWATEDWGTGASVYALDYAHFPILGRKVKGLVIRGGSSSRIYSVHGCEVVIPKRLSTRVRFPKDPA